MVDYGRYIVSILVAEMVILLPVPQIGLRNSPLSNNFNYFEGLSCNVAITCQYSVKSQHGKLVMQIFGRSVQP